MITYINYNTTINYPINYFIINENRIRSSKQIYTKKQKKTYIKAQVKIVYVLYVILNLKNE